MKDASITDVNNTSSEVIKAGDELLSVEDITAPDIPEDILFPDELNRYLRERLQVVVTLNLLTIY